MVDVSGYLEHECSGRGVSALSTAPYTLPMYHHRQVGRIIATLVAIAIVAVVAMAVMTRVLPLLLLAVLMAVVGVVFSSLTIDVVDGELRSHFGLGFMRRRILLTNIVCAKVSPSRWWDGWGIRITPRGWLYNVEGTGAVEIELRSGKRFRLGSDEPEALATAIQSALAGR